MDFDDVIVLVPGFLGFSRTGGFYYFADRVSSTLRGALEAAKRRAIPVVPCCTLPTDRLAARQEKLVSELALMCDRIGNVRRLHLVGHSAGGVDAQLLTCERPLQDSQWTSEANRVREKIKSVIGIAAPHYGTCLSNAPIAKLASQPLRQLVTDPVREVEVLPSIARQLWDMTRLLRYESDFQVTKLLVSRFQDSGRFLWEIIGHRGLIEDLAPAAMTAIRPRCGKGNAFLRSFVTMTPTAQNADPFFRDLHELTANTSEAPPNAAVMKAAIVLNEHAREAIRSGAAIPAFDERTNDGVVNSVRQLVDPNDPDELAGIVVADHADVLGHYDRQDIFIQGKPLNIGLFHSGAGFGDDQFYALYRRVAEILVSQVIP